MTIIGRCRLWNGLFYIIPGSQNKRDILYLGLILFVIWCKIINWLEGDKRVLYLSSGLVVCKKQRTKKECSRNLTLELSNKICWNFPILAKSGSNKETVYEDLYPCAFRVYVERNLLNANRKERLLYAQYICKFREYNVMMVYWNQRQLPHFPQVPFVLHLRLILRR